MAGLLKDRIIGAESGGNATAKNPRSSATGAGQFIEGTWLDMIGKHRPDLAGLPRDQVLALRNDPALSRQMTQAYADENAAGLRAAGLPVNDGTQYLAHFAGLGGARSALSSDSSTPIANVLPADSIQANPFLQGWTAGQLVDWSARKVGSAAPAMTMPGDATRSGQFGVSRVQASPAAAPAMMMPAASEERAETGNPLLAQVLQAVLQPQAQHAAGGAASQQPAGAPRPMMMQQPMQPAQFDAGRFYALLGLRRRVAASSAESPRQDAIPGRAPRKYRHDCTNDARRHSTFCSAHAERIGSTVWAKRRVAFVSTFDVITSRQRSGKIRTKIPHPRC